jgi:hypothetical protein
MPPIALVLLIILLPKGLTGSFQDFFSRKKF